MTEEEKVKELENGIINIGKSVADIKEVDPYFGALLDNSFRIALNIMEDVTLERPTNYFAAFEALTGKSIQSLIEEAQELQDFAVDEEIVDFITADDSSSDDYKQKVSDFKNAMLDV